MSKKHDKGRAALVLVAAMTLLGSAQAEDRVTVNQGVYIGVTESWVRGPDARYRDNSLIADPTLGYRINPQFGVELFARDLCGVFCGLFQGKDFAQADTHTGVAALGYLPLVNGNFKAMGRLGLGRTKYARGIGNTHAARETEATLGAGLAYDFGPMFGIKLEALRYTRAHTNSVSLGAEWRF
ncbi:outer membrane beta-barrel protein [Pelomonas sp. V22]|uniref:outer membrane beta-barrel protein n=1 Tax=Pelomonas sp. V22 TaxID=2822139 RepID=UPI0024A9BD7E|nr:outer membrane beta-barrel protein [Pelomonas sp. V22]MDI4635688.1 outer membrane beta-barrel protein [Pelomonas sp. V22]